MRIIQKSILTEASDKSISTIDKILKYSKDQLQSHFNTVLGSTGNTLSNSYTVVY